MECGRVSGSTKQCDKGRFLVYQSLYCSFSTHKLLLWKWQPRVQVPPPQKMQQRETNSDCHPLGQSCGSSLWEPALQPVRICLLGQKQRFPCSPATTETLLGGSLAVAKGLQGPGARCQGTLCFSVSFNQRYWWGGSHAPHCLLKENELYPHRKSWSKKIAVYRVFSFRFSVKICQVEVLESWLSS